MISCQWPSDNFRKHRGETEANQENLVMSLTAHSFVCKCTHLVVLCAFAVRFYICRVFCLIKTFSYFASCMRFLKLQCFALIGHPKLWCMAWHGQKLNHTLSVWDVVHTVHRAIETLWIYHITTVIVEITGYIFEALHVPQL